MKRFLFVAMIGLALVLTACQSEPAPTPTETATEEPTSAAAVIPTVAPRSTPTPPPPPAPTSTPPDTPTPEATPTPVPSDVWVDAVNGLNLRAEAKADAKLVTTLRHQQHLVAIGAPAGPDAAGITWQNVRTDDGQTGWVSAQFLTKTNPVGPTSAPATSAPATSAPATSAPAASTGDAWVTAADGLNLRAQQATTSTLVALLPFGTHLTLTGTATGPDAGGITWQSVRTDDGKTGFVSAQFISTTQPPTPTATATGTVTQPVTTAANELLRRLNELRIQNGLAAVSLNTALTAAAQRHSQDMARTGNISHTGSDNSTPAQRMRDAGFTGGTGEEAIYGGRASLDDAWYFWTTDRQHANILLTPEYTVVGIAAVNAADRSYYTMVFGKP
jgi:uncharacterized protein YkwD